MNERERVIDEVSRHCDLRERLTLIPPSAKTRGIYFRMMESALGRAGQLERFRTLFPERFPAMLWHPESDFLVRLAVAGSLIASPERVHEGMFEIALRNAVVFAESLIGRTVLRLLSRDPRKLLQQAMAGRRQGFNTGTWELAFPTDTKAIVTMTEEYCFIESYLLGAAQGTFDAIGLPVRTEVVIRDRFNGQHILTWG